MSAALVALGLGAALWGTGGESSRRHGSITATPAGRMALSGRTTDDSSISPQRHGRDADPVSCQIQALTKAASSFLTSNPDDAGLLDIIASILESRRSELSELSPQSRTRIAVAGLRFSTAMDIERASSAEGERWTLSFEPNTLPVGSGLRREHASVDALRLTLDLGADGEASIPTIEVHFVPACRPERLGQRVMSGYALTDEADGRYSRIPYESVILERPDGTIGYECLLSVERSTPHRRPDAMALARVIREAQRTPCASSDSTTRDGGRR